MIETQEISKTQDVDISSVSRPVYRVVRYRLASIITGENMKAVKRTLKVTIEVLSVDSIRTLLVTLAEKIDNEFNNGELVADDGDTIKWEIEHKEITI